MSCFPNVNEAKPKVEKVVVRKNGSRWSADLYWDNGAVWVSWRYGYSSRGRLVDSLSTFGMLIDVPVVRGRDA